jgi:hypothetical protein
MPTTTPDPEPAWRPTAVSHPTPPAPGQAWPPAALGPAFGNPAGLPQPLPPLPSVGTIWANIILLGWLFGIGLIYGCVKAIQGIHRSRQRGLSPAKYIAPLIFIVAALVLLVIIGKTVGSTTGTSGYGS